MSINSVLHTGQQSIDRVLRTGLPVVLVFWRRDVSQSVELDPLLDDLAHQFSGRVLIAKVDAESEPTLVKRYNIRLLPSLVLVKNANPNTTIDGRAADSAIRAWVTYLVQGGAQPAPASGPGSPTGSGQSRPLNGSTPHTASRPSATQARTAAHPVTLTDANFQTTVGQAGVTLVDFWAEWCGPCRMVSPSVDQLAQEFAGRALVGKLNVDQNPRTAQMYNIMSIPALLILRNGRVVDQIVGAQPLPVLRDRLMRVLGS